METCKNIVNTSIASFPAFRKTTPRLAGALVCTALLAGCYIMPIGTGPDGQQHYIYSSAPIVPGQAGSNTPIVIPGGPAPAVLNVRLYPGNDLANQTGVLTGQVTNMMSGKGRFQFHYQGESLVGEATRVSGEERRGVASAYGSRGTFARCEYQMSTAYQGAGTCTFSNGASYQLHIGS